MTRAFSWVVLVLALVFPFLPLGDRTAFVQQIVLFVVTAAILALSWDLLARTGQLSLAHAAFFGVGAYSYAITASLGAPHVLAFVLAGAVAGLVSLVLGVVTLRLHGMYFAIATLAFAEVVKTLVNQWAFTGGPQGLLVPPLLGGGFRELYFVGLGVLLVLIAVSVWTQRSRWGFAFTAIRQGELVARVLGVNATRYKLIAFVVSSVFAGLAGVIVSSRVGYLTPPDAFSVGVSVEALVVPIFGGLYTTAGPVLGAFILHVLAEVLKEVLKSVGGQGQGYLIVYGVVLILSILYLPRGLMGLLGRLERSREHRAGRGESRV